MDKRNGAECTQDEKKSHDVQHAMVQKYERRYMKVN
jgi:hypothetical protein